MTLTNRYALPIVLLLIIVGSVSIGVYGSSTLEQQLASSEGPQRIQLLNALAESLIERDPDQAIEHAREALKLAEESKLPDLAADSHNIQGYALFQKGDYRTAIEQFQNAISLSEPAGYQKGTAYGRNGYGLVWGALGNYVKALDSFNAAARLFIALGDRQGEGYTLSNAGTIHQATGAYDDALKAYLEALRINEALNNTEEMATIYNLIGSLNADRKNFETAFDYYTRALDIYETTANDIGRSDTLMNIGSFFQRFGYIEEAMGFFNKAYNLSATMHSAPRIANALSALGYGAELLQNYDDALKYYQQALQYGEAIGDSEITVAAWNNIGTVHHRQGDYQAALENHIRAFEASKTMRYEPGLESSLKNIANDYQAMGRYQDATHYFILYNELRDALDEQQQAQSFADTQTLYETEKKDEQIQAQQADIAAKERRARLLIGIIVAVLTFLAITGVQALIIAKEKRKSEALLLNVLPAKVADDLKRTGHTEPERFDAVTILFSDIVGFTDISSTMDPSVLIGELNTLFTAFDAILDKHRCQRIKTIGDAYFAVCGLPEPDPDHVSNIMNAARDMLSYLHAYNASATTPWEIRIGVHTGPVVGGVVGVKKYIYDIFGDTVNTASRMESNGAPMRINVSESARMALGDTWQFDEREPLPVKGKGLYRMFFLHEEGSEINSPSEDPQPL